MPNEDPDLDHRIDHDDDDDDDEEEVNTTQPFQPGAYSTPHTSGAAYHHGEAIEMPHLPRERGSGDTIPEVPEYGELVDKPTIIQRFKEQLKIRFPKVDFSKIVISIGERKGTAGKAVALGPKGGETPIFKQDNTLTQAFQRQYGSFLGPRAEEIIV